MFGDNCRTKARDLYDLYFMMDIIQTFLLAIGLLIEGSKGGIKF